MLLVAWRWVMLLGEGEGTYVGVGTDKRSTSAKTCLHVGDEGGGDKANYCWHTWTQGKNKIQGKASRDGGRAEDENKNHHGPQSAALTQGKAPWLPTLPRYLGHHVPMTQA